MTSTMQLKHEARVTGEGYGYVYAMSYPGSDKVKIGHSLNPTNRAVEIGGTLAPEQPVVEAYYWCSERREAVERRAHELQASTRHNGEWFKLEVTDALLTIQRAATEVGVQIILAFSRKDYEAQAAAAREEKIKAWGAMTYPELEDVLKQVKAEARRSVGKAPLDSRKAHSKWYEKACAYERKALENFHACYPEFGWIYGPARESVRKTTAAKLAEQAKLVEVAEQTKQEELAEIAAQMALQDRVKLEAIENKIGIWSLAAILGLFAVIQWFSR